jgi:hypothetical protein
MAARQDQRAGAQVTIELAIGNLGTCEGDISDVCPEEEGSLHHGSSRVVANLG